MKFTKNDFPQPASPFKNIGFKGSIIQGYETDLLLTCCLAQIFKILESCRCFSLSNLIFELSSLSGITTATV